MNVMVTSSQGVEIRVPLSDTLAARLAPVQEQLPEILALVTGDGLPISAKAYLEVLEFLASAPSPEETILFRLSPTLQESITQLQERNNDGTITVFEKAELERLLRVEHLMRAIKLQSHKKLN